MAKKINKITFLGLLEKIIDSADIGSVTKERLVRYYMLPQSSGKALIENENIEIGTVERPNAEEIRIEDNPKLKAEFEDTEKLMSTEQE